MRIVIRADASPALGMGHVTRCLALAQQLRAHGSLVEFVCRDSAGTMLSTIESSHGFRVNRLPPGVVAWQDDLRSTLGLACCDARPDWIIVDHYLLDSKWEEGAKESCGQLLVIDDIADRHHDSDLLLDQNLHSTPEERYLNRVPQRCRMLLGPRFALLRSEFHPWRGWRRNISPRATRVLVTLGGGDAEGITSIVLSGLVQIADFPMEIHVLAGADHPRGTQLQAFATQLGSAGRHKIVFELYSDRMPDLMAWADFAVTGGGSTAWELAFMGLPSLMVTLSEDQRPNVAAFAASNLSVDLGDSSGLEPAQIAAQAVQLAVDTERRGDMSRRLQKLVDGQGAERVAIAMRELVR